MKYLLIVLLLACRPPFAEGDDEPDQGRPPASEAEARRWLENMVWHHRFIPEEVSAATGWNASDVESWQSRLGIQLDNAPGLDDQDALRVLPYPGGRHPRIGFLEGAIDPQRETKVSVFTPWDPNSYVVADVPEAIWSNLGLTYLAHTHVPTLWTAQAVELERLEWSLLSDGQLICQRELPNGIAFGTRVTPRSDSVRFEMWLQNGTDEPLTGLRVQNCVMLKGATGFTQQNNDNKRLQGAYAACHDESGRRWVITAWKPLHRCWANERCPCLHSDPQFPDCAPGETVRIYGWLSFYEGTEIAEEIERIEGLDWDQP